MTTVIAAIDNSAAARPVLAAAAHLADLVHAHVEALHVREDGDRTAVAAARQAGVALRELVDPAVETLIDAGRGQDVAALALGARGTLLGRQPAGHVALEIITSVSKPLLVVPPNARVSEAFRRVLVPLDGTRATAEALRETLELATTGRLEVVLLHVHTAESLPLFGDHAQHEADAWRTEFAARHYPGGAPGVSVEVRVGPPAALVLDVAAEAEVDLIALGWRQNLSEGRAAVVREVLAASPVPVLLVPVTPAEASAG